MQIYNLSKHIEYKQMKRILVLLTIMFVLIYICKNISAQSVGLVLSGGGAKGLAHIGVLKALEEKEIPVDYISGTSMGAIVGAMYAAGYSPHEIENIAKSTEFQDWATGKIPDEYRFNYKKRYLNSSMFSFTFVRGDTITVPRLPTNIIPTHQMDIVLLRLLAQANAAADYNFDNLFVPFRCVAADVYNNRPVILRDGQLSAAVRASSAFPFVFSPVTINDVLLFDGGIYNNFPYELLTDEFNADIIVGSKTSANPPEPTEENIVLQIENMIAGQTDYDLSKVDGVLIETDLYEIGVLDFHLVDDIIEKGYRTTLKHIERLKERVYRNIPVKKIEERRAEFRRKFPPLNFKDVHVTGASEEQVEFIKSSFRDAGEVFDFKEFEKAYFKLVADNNIRTVFPAAFYNQEKEYYELHLRVRAERELEVQVGGNISSEFNQGYAGINYRLLGRNSYNLKGNVYFGRLYSSVMVRGQLEMPSSAPLFTDISITLNRWDYFTSISEPFFEDVINPYLMHYDGNIRLNLGLSITSNSYTQLAYSIARMRYHYYQVDKYTQADTADVTNFDLNSVSLIYKRNTLNRIQYPEEGSNLYYKAQFIGGNESYLHGSVSPDKQDYKESHYYFQIQARYVNYRRISSAFRLGYFAECVLSSTPSFRNYISTIMNAPVFQPTPHSKTLFMENYRAHSYAAAGVIPVINFRESLHLRIGAYIFQPYKSILEDEDYRAAYSDKFYNTRFTANTALVYHTPFGPASLSLNYYENSGSRFYFLFKFGYILFNQKATD